MCDSNSLTDNKLLLVLFNMISYVISTLIGALIGAYVTSWEYTKKNIKIYVSTNSDLIKNISKEWEKLSKFRRPNYSKANNDEIRGIAQKIILDCKQISKQLNRQNTIEIEPYLENLEQWQNDLQTLIEIINNLAEETNKDPSYIPSLSPSDFDTYKAGFIKLKDQFKSNPLLNGFGFKLTLRNFLRNKWDC